MSQDPPTPPPKVQPTRADLISAALLMALSDGAIDADATVDALASVLAAFVVRSPHSVTLAGRLRFTDEIIKRLREQVRGALAVDKARDALAAPVPPPQIRRLFGEGMR